MSNSLLYLDSSVLLVYLLGSAAEPTRHAAARDLFTTIDNGDLTALISLYSFQEIYSFCEDNYPVDDVPEVFRQALLRLLASPVCIKGLLTREERLIHERRFHIRDASDTPHVISALLNHCEVIVTYDDHFQDVANVVESLTPEELLQRLCSA
jgi:predicted nucleic acid-binding protein